MRNDHSHKMGTSNQRGGNMQDEWVYLETRGAGTDEVRSLYRHSTCGTVLEILQGHMASICPKCQPEEWTVMKTLEMEHR
jgi:hypothetical protein